ncbi:MAG: 23S rRNA (uracil(1939)-C(5))-methyltransferase RlmD [Clostridia bacterium]|nr:23S rRNA (uracil(1939)-C(5))-methyltransferase RlmD [Clostridia bacterium]
MESIVVTGIGSQLQGVGRLADGRAVFVPGAIPGERVEIEITREKGRFCEASLSAVLEPSPDRIAPICPHAGVCGGCQARHIRYERTLALKGQIVADALTRLGGIDAPNVLDALGCASPDRYRNKAEYPIARQDGCAVIGMHAAASKRVVPLADCPLQASQSVQALEWLAARLNGLACANHLRYLVTRVNRAGALMLVFCADAPVQGELAPLVPALRESLPALKSLYFCQLNRRPAHALDGRCTKLWGADALTETLLGLTFSVSPQSFFQVNPAQTELLYAKALEAAGIEPDCGLNVLDAYCGAGTITLAAARWARFATGIEIVPPAIADAKRNAARNGLSDRARFICADAVREIPRLLAKGERFDAAILDPPRKGADPALLEALVAAEIPTLAYVSCNPATLARDVKILAAGGYRLKWAQPVDMFPWTGHIETVVLMSRYGSR